MARRIRAGVRAGFFAEVLTHEQKLGVLSLEEWEQILDQGLRATARLERSFASHDEVGRYLRARRGVRLSAVRREGRRAGYELAGSSTVSLRLAIFRGDAESLERSWVDVPPFAGACRGESGG